MSSFITKLCSSSNIIMVIIKETDGWEISIHRGDEKCVQHFSWKTGRKRPCRKIRHGLEDNIEISLEEMDPKLD